ncbi:MAG: hypothetical protein OEY85_06185 [Rhodospirillales bacterium]|nr:hypothetical protein [Rhodospirillales bacterium]
MTRILSALALIFLLAACAAQVDNMAVLTSPDVEAAAASKLAGKIHLERVSVAEKTSPFWTSEIGDEAFAFALVQSLDSHKLLSPHELDARYDLTAKLIKVDQQTTGFDLVVSTEVEYLLVDRNARRAFYHMAIVAPYKAKFSENAILTKRLQLANEGSIRKNIRKFISEILAKAQELN